MAIKKYLDYTGLQQYDTLIKEKIAEKESNVVYITITAPSSSATSGNLTSEQLSKLKNAIQAGTQTRLILSVTASPAYKEYFYLGSNRAAQGYVSYFSDDVSNQEIFNRAISITLSTGSWVMLSIKPGEGGADGKETIFMGSRTVTDVNTIIATADTSLVNKSIQVVYKCGYDESSAAVYTCTFIGSGKGSDIIVYETNSGASANVQSMYTPSFAVSSTNVVASITKNILNLGVTSSTISSTATAQPGTGFLQILAVYVLPDTWYTIEGTYKLKDTVTLTALEQYMNFDRNFADTQNYMRMRVTSSDIMVYPKSSPSTPTYIYHNGAFSSSKILNFSTKQFVQKEFLEWFTANAEEYNVYEVKTNLVNVTETTSPKVTAIGSGETATLTFAGNTGYSLPDSVTVAGATYTWTQSTGTLVISNPTQTVMISVTGTNITLSAPVATLSPNGVLTWTENNPSGSVKNYQVIATFGSSSKSQTLATSTRSLDLTTWLTDVNTYTITVLCLADTVTTGYRNSPASNAVTYTVEQPQLSAPANLTADGTTVSWDAVENAESYDVYADDTVLLGNTTGGAASSGETWLLNETPTITPAQDNTYSIAFTSNNTTYSTFKILYPIGNTGIYYDSTKVYNGDNITWANIAYRTVKFDTAPTGDLLTWLQNNGTKQ